MGLDVYLYHCPDRASARAAEESYEKASEALYQEAGGWKKIKDNKEKIAEIDQKKNELAKSFGCTGRHEAHHTVTKIELDSKLHPECMFKIGYFRSSYNSSGFNSYLQQYDIPTLNEILNPSSEYEFTPDWKSSLEIANKAVSLYKEHLHSPVGNIHIMSMRANIFADTLGNGGPTNEKEALNILKKELTKYKPGQRGPFTAGSYANGVGEFHLDGLNCVGFMMGTDHLFRRPVPCCYIAYKTKEDVGKVAEVEDRLDRKEKDWYLQSLEVVRETIQWVLSKPDPQCYYLHWSG
jgi:hypothetical protein